MAAIREWFGAYNIIYDWFVRNYGYAELEEYWRNIARNCYAGLAVSFRENGPDYVKEYFESIFQEDGGKAAGVIGRDDVTIEVMESPDVKWMQAFGNPHFKTVPYYFNHYEIIFGEIARMAGLEFQMMKKSEDGRCKWRFCRDGWGTAR